MRVDIGAQRMWFDVVGAQLEPDGATMRERPTIVMLHGGPGFDHSVFRPAFDALADVAQVVYVDHSGHGRSDQSPPARWNLGAWASDIAAFCAALEIDRPIILGWSFGGMVAIRLAADHPELASGLVLLSTAARLPLSRLRECFARSGGPAAGDAAAAFWADPNEHTLGPYLDLCQPLYSPRALDAESAARTVLRPEILLGGWREALTFDLRDRLAAISCPTLVLSGDLDPVTPPEAADELLAGIDPRWVSDVRFHSSGHFVADTEPGLLMAAVRRFVGGLHD